MNIQENGNDVHIDIEQFYIWMCKTPKVIMIKFIWKKTLVSIIHQFLDFVE